MHLMDNQEKEHKCIDRIPDTKESGGSVHFYLAGDHFDHQIVTGRPGPQVCDLAKCRFSQRRGSGSLGRACLLLHLLLLRLLWCHGGSHLLILLKKPALGYD